MKSRVFIVCLFLFFLASCQKNEEEKTIDSIFSFQLINESEYQISGLNEKVSEIEIPLTYQDKPVTKIASYAFQYKHSIKSIKLTDNLKEIGEYAFLGCINLEKIEISKNIERIQKRAFYGCTSLEKVIFAEASSLTKLEEGIFYNCSNLNEIALSNNLMMISNFAFYNCSSLKMIFLPKQIDIIERYSFLEVKNMIFYVENEYINSTWARNWNNGNKYYLNIDKNDLVN